jgi:putative membrane protein
LHEADPPDPAASDVTRRTRLAAERTWLAWWRTGVAAAAVAIAVGRILPGLSGGARWPFRLLGIGYGVLAVAVLLIGGVRQRRSSEALRRGSYEDLSPGLVTWLTGAAVVLSAGGVILVAAAL